ncbi:MAG: DEAD/DEAH box helicase [Porphyrobacter sp.]|nr:DEAD/DEAH box helicase [Porphyrobacter sp.]
MNFPPLSASIEAALAERAYGSATPVQAEVLRPEAQGRDLVVSAQTGSGKTLAFGLALAADLLDAAGCAPPAPSPRALVIAPTRELALQVSRELAWLYGRTGARIATCVGGMNPSAERKVLACGPTIVVGTPGRLRDHLERGALDLAQLAAVVLDEADEMLDMGFREELEAILDATPGSRRTLLFSATMPRPIEALARRYQRDALRIAALGEGRGHGDIAYQAVTVSPPEIENAVVNLLRFHEAETAILFCATREKVRHLHATLQERGFAAVALSGEHSQTERNQALQALRDRRARVCVATDVAARGIDLPTLSLVVHVEIPRDAETLQHRSGRTGRAGKKGTAVLIVPFARRKRVESMLRHAGIAAQWTEVPGREAIKAMDRERLLEKLLEPVEVDADDRALAERLLVERSPAQIAAMLVRAHSARLPEPEEIAAEAQDTRRDGPRPGFEDTVWFRLDIGRRDNADPRWILPLLCRRGHITRGEVGAIRIGHNETYVQIPRAIAERFAGAVARTATIEGEEEAIAIHRSETGPPQAPRKSHAPRRGFVKPKPVGHGQPGRAAKRTKPQPGRRKQP